MTIKELVLTEGQLAELFNREADNMTYPRWMKEFTELVESCGKEIPQGEALIDKLGYISRKAYLVGFYHGLGIFNDSVKSFAAEEESHA